MLKCARGASLKRVSGLNWRMLHGKLLYSVIVLRKKLFLQISPHFPELMYVACDLVL